MKKEGAIELTRVPTDDDLARAYFELAARGADLVGARARWPYAPKSDEELVCLLAEMSRYDARLLGGLVQFCLASWRRLSPVALRAAMTRTRWPQAVCVVVEFMVLASRDRELTYWARHVTAGWPRLDPAVHFFVDDVQPGERSAPRRVGRSLRPYSRWGFLAIERPTIDPHKKLTVGRYDTRTRSEILSTLAARSTDGLTLTDYLDAIDHGISRQQALSDLRAAGLSPDRRGPGATWTKKRARR